ncbi:MAG: hypothetical protein AB8F74_19535 [Saprospiraceae bacterium]
MKPVLQICLLLFFFQSVNVLYGQEEMGTIIFRLYPVKDKLYVKAMDSVYVSPKITLPAGSHDVVLWTQNRKPLSTTIQIFPDSVTYFKDFLPATASFDKYSESVNVYKRKVVLPKVISLSVSSSLTIGAVASYIGLRSQWKRVERNYNSYRFASPFENQISETEKELESSKDKYESKKKTFISLGIATGVSWTVSAFIYRKLRKRKKPILVEEEPPFRITYMPNFESRNFEYSQIQFTFVKSINYENF